MPIYEYKCDACGKSHEQIRRMTDADNNVECPECRSSSVTRQLSSFATHSAASQSAAAPTCGMGACGGGRCAFNDN